jgi:hypothetical protein
MTSFNKYINGTDPADPVTSYNYMQGLQPDGSPLADADVTAMLWLQTSTRQFPTVTSEERTDPRGGILIEMLPPLRYAIYVTVAGVGAAITGMRPVVEILFVDFALLAMDQIINQAAKGLGTTVTTEVQTCTDLLDAVDDLAMPNKPIEDVSSLADAATTLTTMQGALARKGVIGSSEYSRYNAAIGRATKEIGRTAKMTYVPRGSTQVVKDVVELLAEAAFG